MFRLRLVLLLTALLSSCAGTPCEDTIDAVLACGPEAVGDEEVGVDVCNAALGSQNGAKYACVLECVLGDYQRGEERGSATCEVFNREIGGQECMDSCDSDFCAVSIIGGSVPVDE